MSAREGYKSYTRKKADRLMPAVPRMVTNRRV
jgi:hypothetical protein